MTGELDQVLFLQIEGTNAGGCVTHRLSSTNWADAGRGAPSREKNQENVWGPKKDI